MINAHQMILVAIISALGFGGGLLCGAVWQFARRQRAVSSDPMSMNQFEFLVRKFYHDNAYALSVSTSLQTHSCESTVYAPLIVSLRGLLEDPSKRETLNIETALIATTILKKAASATGLVFVSEVAHKGVLESTVSAKTERGLTMTVKIQPSLFKHLVVPYSLIAGLGNVIANAVKFVDPQSGRIGIEIRFNEQTGRLKAFVTDNGTGMTDQMASKLYKQNVKSNTSGLGIGGVLTAKDLKADGGDIALVKNITRPTKELLFDRGTTTSITVPFRSK